MLSFVILAQAATAAPPAQSQTPPTQTFTSSVQVPDEAVEKGWSGTVKADLTISPEGHVTACKIVKSSGHRLLDDFTCDMLAKRAKFTPAHDKDGKPIEDHFLTPPINYNFEN